ncbi:MAG: PIN domain nuclease [Caldilineaceae bacterium]|nr:PIN domain nuclease [Caldilineaceae bacterium]
MRWELLLRILVMATFGLLGWEAGRTVVGVEGFEDLSLRAARVLVPSVMGAGLLGFFLAPWITLKPAKAMRASLRHVPTVQLVAATLGLVIGLMIAALLAYPLSLLPTPFGTVLPFVGAIVLGYLGVTIMMVRQREIFAFLRLGRNPANSEPVAPEERHKAMMLLDTSVIIDGRIADVAETGFLWAVLAVPRFVLNELQYIADSPEMLRRNRGRRGLEMLDRLRNCEQVEIVFLDQDPSDARQVDDKLVSLGLELNAAVVTNDFNLNRVARLQGVQVLNINELANAVKSVVLPGEELGIKVIQEGKEINQGVGYLEDGTMVVVENGRRFLSREITVQVTKVLQTNAGRLIFAVPDGKPREEKQSSLSHRN